MITVLGLYVGTKDRKPNVDNIRELADRFRTEKWEFNCYSQDIVLVTEHGEIDKKTLDNSTSDCTVRTYSSWEPHDHVERLSGVVRKHFKQMLQNEFSKIVGLKINTVNDEEHMKILNKILPKHSGIVDTVGQLAAMSDPVEKDSPVVIQQGWDLQLRHDPWRYFKILKNDQIERKLAGNYSTTGGSGGKREPVNSSNIVFCHSKDTLSEHCIGHYHALYTLTRPIIMENCFRYQLRPNFSTLKTFHWDTGLEMVAEHLQLRLVTYDEFEDFEAEYWNNRENAVNKNEFTL